MILLLLCTLSVALAFNLPEGIKLCHRSDPNLKKCVAQSLQEGLVIFAPGFKSLGVPKIEPLYIEKMEINGETGQAVRLHQKYENVYVHGMATAKITISDMALEDGNCFWTAEFELPHIIMEADYELEGQILVFPLTGHGKCNITEYILHNRHSMKCELYTKKNQTYLRITEYTTDLNAENIYFDFQNLIPGNDQIAGELLKTINENSQVVFKEVKPAIEKIFALLFMQNANKVFAKIPFNQIFLD